MTYEVGLPGFDGPGRHRRAVWAAANDNPAAAAAAMVHALEDEASS